MKVKEMPLSLWTAWQLKRLTVRELQQATPMILPVIVSLTSIPSRLPTIHLTVRSLLHQQSKPEKIILWLNQALQQRLPKSLTALIGDFFEIRFVDLECSHRKLIHALDVFPEKVIVTCDDDLMYDKTWLTRLYEDHLNYPVAIIAHECRQIRFDAKGKPLPYSEWKLVGEKNYTADWVMPIGYGGVLYPPHCLHSDVQNRALFLSLAPKADDLWFKAMSYRAGTQTRRSSNPGNKPCPVLGSQKISLKKTNVRQNGNYLQWCALCDYFNLLA